MNFVNDQKKEKKIVEILWCAGRKATLKIDNITLAEIG